MLTEVVDRLLEGLAGGPEVELRGQSLRQLADLIDSDEASPGVRPQLHAQMVKELDALVEAGGTREGSRPRLGRLRGEQARLVLLGLGMPPAHVDDTDEIDFGFIAALRIKRARRRAQLEPNPALDAVLEYSERTRNTSGETRGGRRASTRSDA